MRLPLARTCARSSKRRTQHIFERPTIYGSMFLRRSADLIPFSNALRSVADSRSWILAGLGLAAGVLFGFFLAQNLYPSLR